MTQQEIDGNKLIDAFAPEITKERQSKVPSHIAEHEGLKYNSSWDWLMPVVEKIESLVDDNVGHITISIYGSGCEINRFGYKKIAKNFSRATSKIYNTWECVVKYLKWYNQNKSK